MKPIFDMPERLGTYGVFAGLMVLIAFLAFGNLSEHLFEGDDFEYVQEVGAAREDLSMLFADERILPGRPVVDLLFLFILKMEWGTPAFFHVFVVLLHFCLHIRSGFWELILS
jgi:hypothetical protein